MKHKLYVAALGAATLFANISFVFAQTSCGYPLQIVAGPVPTVIAGIRIIGSYPVAHPVSLPVHTVPLSCGSYPVSHPVNLPFHAVETGQAVNLPIHNVDVAEPVNLPFHAVDIAQPVDLPFHTVDIAHPVQI